MFKLNRVATQFDILDAGEFTLRTMAGEEHFTEEYEKRFYNEQWLISVSITSPTLSPPMIDLDAFASLSSVTYRPAGYWSAKHQNGAEENVVMCCLKEIVAYVWVQVSGDNYSIEPINGHVPAGNYKQRAKKACEQLVNALNSFESGATVFNAVLTCNGELKVLDLIGFNGILLKGLGVEVRHRLIQEITAWAPLVSSAFENHYSLSLEGWRAHSIMSDEVRHEKAGLLGESIIWLELTQEVPAISVNVTHTRHILVGRVMAQLFNPEDSSQEFQLGLVDARGEEAYAGSICLSKEAFYANPIRLDELVLVNVAFSLSDQLRARAAATEGHLTPIEFSKDGAYVVEARLGEEHSNCSSLPVF